MAGAFTLALSLACVTTASATSDDGRRGDRPVAAVETLSALWGEGARPVHSERRMRPLGRAPYLCTPSGFGRIATCSLRSPFSAN